MAESLDAYCDSFLLTLGPYGASLSFQLSLPHPDPTSPAVPTKVATIRMSIEHAKTMAMIMKRYIQRFEEQEGVQARVSPRVLAQLGIGPEDWDTFWKSKP